MPEQGATGRIRGVINHNRLNYVFFRWALARKHAPSSRKAFGVQDKIPAFTLTVRQNTVKKKQLFIQLAWRIRAPDVFVCVLTFR
ncbi:MAG: hypothetical protein OEZ59_03195 [Deltaproteobacteria bacterium]|nr:hypothetical protein [Deltaproteobacteria bacterium]